LVATTIDEGESTTLTGIITDPGILDTFTLTVDWGDGSPTETIGYPAGTTSFSETHQYLDDNIYTITLTIEDNDLGSSSETTTVTVNNVAPTLTISGDPDVDEGSIYTLYLTSDDPGDDTIYEWIIDWGDGTVITYPGDPDYVTHTYVDGLNIYSIGVIASDEDGTYPVSIRNVGFEMGDFTDWTVYVPYGGSALVVQSHYTGYNWYYPMDGAYFARLKTDGPGSYTYLRQTVYLSAGQTISGWAAFDAQDYMPFNDNAMVRILDETGIQVIAQPWYSSVS
jgi:hypothetical protein